MKKLSFVLIFPLMLFAFSAASAKEKPDQISVKPGESSEDCLELTEGQVLWYSFEASGPVDFNIHYHQADKVVLGEDKKNSVGEKGTYRAPKPQTYCMMWTNNGAGLVNIEYKARAGIE